MTAVTNWLLLSVAWKSYLMMSV